MPAPTVIGFRSSSSFFCIIALFLFSLVSAQSSTTQAANITTTLTTSSFTSIATSESGTQNVTSTTVIQTIFNVTLTATSTSPSSTANATTSTTPTPTATPISLDTRIDPGFSVLGAILIITGLPSAFWGHKNRWSSFFIIGFYTLALVCLALILKFGVLSSVNPPNKTLRGLFVLACSVAGIAGGGVAIFFWQQAKYFIGGWGGFALGLWIQCFRNGGLIRPIGLRWILYIALGVIGFVVCTIPKVHYQVLLTSTAIVGASAFILGIDCFTTAGLKEFYIWNLGFDGIFPKFQNAGIHFPVSQMMEVELGLIAAVTLMGAAVQWRVLTILQLKLKEISAEQKKRDEELEAQATARFTSTAKEMDEWEREHGRKDSQYSSILPLMKDQEHGTPVDEASQFTLVGAERRVRRASGISEFLAATPLAEDEFGRPKDKRQHIGVLPAMDLGTDIEEDLPRAFVGELKDAKPEMDLTAEELDELKRKEELKAEIQNLRKSIEVLASESSGSRNGSRRHSFTSRRTLSQDLVTVMEGPTHLRPPRPQDPRARVQSMDGLSHYSSADVGASIGRPVSAPLRDENWDTYVHDRKLFQPPSGVTAPIAVSSAQPKRASQYITVPNAVTDALTRRHQQENAFELGELGYSNAAGRKYSPETPETSSDERPVGLATRAQIKNTTGDSSAHSPVTILPPRKGGQPIAAPSPQRPTNTRTRTFEELNERHREKMRDLQGPLSKAEQEQAQLAAAKSRWEKSKALERQAMMKREAEKANAAKQKGKRRSDEIGDSAGLTTSKVPERRASHTRSLSADQLARLPGTTSSKRQSLMKVEDWQRFQEEAGVSHPQERSPKRDSAVPFPAASREPGHSSERRRSSRMMGSPRDPPS